MYPIVINPVPVLHRKFKIIEAKRDYYLLNDNHEFQSFGYFLVSL